MRASTRPCAAGRPTTNAQILALDRVRLKLAHQAGLRFEGLGDHQQSAGILIQPMHNARTRHDGKRRGVMEQGVEQRAVGVAAARMHHQPGCLVDHEYLLVLVQDHERNLLRSKRARSDIRFCAQLDTLAAPNLVLGRSAGSVDCHARTLDPVLQAAAREMRQQPCQGLIQAQAGQFRRHAQLQWRVASVWRRLRRGVSAIIRRVFFENPHAK